MGAERMPPRGAKVPTAPIFIISPRDRTPYLYNNQKASRRSGTRPTVPKKTSGQTKENGKSHNPFK